MSEWIDRIKTHQVWQELATLGPVIDQAAAREGNDTPVIDSLERLRVVLAFCGKRLAAMDPVLVEPRPLAALNSALTNARTEVQSFIANGNVGHLTNANSHADNVLAALSAILSPQASDDLTVISDAAASYRAALEKYLREAQASYQTVAGNADAVRVKLTELSNEVAAEKQRLAALVTDYQEKFSTAQEARAQEFTAAQTERQQKFVTSASENQAQVAAAQEARAKEFTDAQTDRKEKYTALVIDYTQKLTEQNTEFTAQREAAVKKYQENLAVLKTEYEQAAKGILDKIDAYKKQVEKLVGVIGNLGVTSGYLKIANHARIALYLWQFLTVAALLGLIFVAYVIAFSPPVSESVFFQGLSTRIFLSLTVGVFAAYAAKQAANFWQIERRNRKLALELEALGPYIAPLPTEMQNKFREELGNRSFGVPDGDFQKASEGHPVTALDLLKSKELREFVTDIVKAAK
jgi:hypothetical protein